MVGGKRGMMGVTDGPFPSRPTQKMSRPKMHSTPIISTGCSRRTSSLSITPATRKGFLSPGLTGCATPSGSPTAVSPLAEWCSSTRTTITSPPSGGTASRTTRRASPQTERRAPARSSHPNSALSTFRGEPVSVMHIAAEFYPFARSGGLAEAVANLGRYHSASGVRPLAILPLYRSARQAAGELIPVGEPFRIRIGASEETGRLLRQRDQRPGPAIYFIEHDGFFDRERLYGDPGGDYPDNHLRYAFFCLAALDALPRLVTGPVLLHAHDWHAALALVYLRTRLGRDARYANVRSVLSVHNAGYQGHYSPAVLQDLGLPWELFNWRYLEWYGKVNILKGGLVFADRVVTVRPNHANELRTPGGGFGLHDVFEWLGPRFSGILKGIEQAGWDPARGPPI